MSRPNQTGIICRKAGSLLPCMKSVLRPIDLKLKYYAFSCQNRRKAS